MYFDPPGRPPTLYAFSPSTSTSPPAGVLSFLSTFTDPTSDSRSSTVDSTSSSNGVNGENASRHLAAIRLDSLADPSFKLINTENLTLDTERTLSLEEKLRRERQRMQGTGVTNYEWCYGCRQLPHSDPSAPVNEERGRILVPLDGNVYLQDGQSGILRCVYDKDLFDSDEEMRDSKTEAVGVVGRDSSAIDPHLSPDGSRVAFVIAGDIYAIDASSNKPNASLTRITFGGGKDGVYNGLADFIAQEEMDRYR